MGNTLFHKVDNAEQACDLLSKYGETARVFAGGTDLMVLINRRLMHPEVLIYIGDCGSNYIKEEEGKLIIGAATTHSEIIKSKLAQEKAPLLVEAVKHIASNAVRNMGTLGGNICNASPAADSATALLALGATVRIKSADGIREIDIKDFFLGPKKTVLNSNELLQEIVVPEQNENNRWAWYKIGRRKADTISIVSMAIDLQLHNNKCSEARIALGSVAPTPLLVENAGRLLEAKQLSGQLINKVSEAVYEETSPIDDGRATAWYRRKVSKNLVKKLLKQISV